MSRKERRRLQNIVDDMGYRNYYDDDVEVRKAGKMGYGVFALRQFSIGELIFPIQGQLIPAEEYDGSDYAIDF
ncbi:MAG: SET domain-containing protein, partial [Planctomycetota bacterium]